jgi:uncharacterized membrane protein YfcA
MLPDMEWLPFYLLVGAFTGLLAGLLGVGGGLIVVPALAMIFVAMGVDEGVYMHLAVGTSLATIAATSLSSIYAHHRHQAVDWGTMLRLTPGLVSGAWLGSWLADLLPSSGLRVFFGLFELAVAAQMAWAVRAQARHTLPGTLGLGGYGMGIGIISAVAGIGGGTLTVPLLSWCGVSMRHAVATSAACGLPIALAGMLGFIVAGWHQPMLPTASSGYVHWPSWAGIAAASVLSAPLGARLAHRLPVPVLRRVFAMFLALVGLRMLYLSP